MAEHGGERITKIIPGVPLRPEHDYNLMGDRIVFAWLPARMYADHSGRYRCGFAWLRPVLRVKAIGEYRYFHIEIERSKP